MRKRTTGMIVAATSAMLGVGTLSFAQQSDPAAEQQRQQSEQQRQQSEQSAQQSQQSGQQADQQIQQAMQKIQQQGGEQAADQLFLLKTAIHSEAELQLAKQAQQKSQSDEVKQLAKQIEQDHYKANQQLHKTAQELQVQIPQGLPSLKQQEIQILTSLPAEQFDKQFVAHMNAAHAQDVAMFQAVQETSQNEQVKQFAQQQLPVLQRHKQQAMQTASAVGLTGLQQEAVPAGARTPGEPAQSTPQEQPGQSTQDQPGQSAPQSN